MSATVLHVVLQLSPGFAREDAPTADVVGVYTDPVVAHQVATLAGPGTHVKPMPLDSVPPGLMQTAKALGFNLKAG